MMHFVPSVFSAALTVSSIGTLCGYLIGVKAGTWIERRWPRQR